VTLSSHSAEDSRCTLLAAIETTVSGLSGIVLQDAPHERLALPLLGSGDISPDDGDDEAP